MLKKILRKITGSTPKEEIQKAAFAYYQYYKTKDDQYWWGWGAFSDPTDRGNKYARFHDIKILIEEAPFEEDYLYYLGAGPLENLNTVTFLKWLQTQKGYSRDSETDKKLCVALTGMFWTGCSLENMMFMSNHIQYHRPDWQYEAHYQIKDLYFHISILKPEWWKEYKAIRIKGHETDPQAFGKSLAEESAYPEEHWQNRLREVEQGESYLYFARHKIVKNDKVTAIETIGIIGAYFRKDEPRTACVVAVYVRPEFRNQGVASVLMWYLLQKLKKDPRAKTVKLTVNVDQTRALELYKKFGFVITKKLTAILGDGKEHAEYEMILRP